LLIKRDSRIFFNEFLAMFNFLPIRILEFVYWPSTKTISFNDSLLLALSSLKQIWVSSKIMHNLYIILFI